MAGNGGGARPGDGKGGGIPDGLLIGLLAFLLGVTLMAWTATGFAGLLAHGAWPDGVTLAETPLALRRLLAAPHDLPAAWPTTPPDELSGYGLFWGLLIGELMVFVVLTVFVMGVVTRWRAVRADRRAERTERLALLEQARREERARRRIQQGKGRTRGRRSKNEEYTYEAALPAPAPEPDAGHRTAPVPAEPVTETAPVAVVEPETQPLPATTVPVPAVTAPTVPSPRTPSSSTAQPPPAAPPPSRPSARPRAPCSS